MEAHCQIILFCILAYFSKSNAATLGGVYTDAYENDHHQRVSKATRHSSGHDDSKILRNLDVVTRSLSDAEEYPNYPAEEIREYIKNNALLKEYFISSRQLPQIGNRNSMPESSDESICQITSYKLLYPRRLRNVNNDLKTIVNIPDEYEQGIETKTCFSRKCGHMDSLPFGYTSYCQQEFITKELMVYNSTTAFDLFRFPSCCVCKIKQV